MQFRSCLLAAALLCCTWAASAQIYKCSGSNGRTVFQQAPCDGGKQVNAAPAIGSENTPEARLAQQAAAARLAKLKYENDIRESIRKHLPMRTMSEKQLFESMGKPDKTNAANYSGEQNNQHIWQRSDGTWYVYTKNGIVDSIQHTPPNPEIVQRPQEPCPTLREIREAEVSASSIALSHEQKRHANARVERMRQRLRECGG